MAKHTATLRLRNTTENECEWMPALGETIMLNVDDGDDWFAEAPNGDRWSFDPETDATGLFGEDYEVPDCFVIETAPAIDADGVHTYTFTWES